MKSGRKIPRKDDTLIERLNEKYAGDKVVPYMGNNNLPTAQSTFEYDKDRVRVIGRAHENILYFAQHFFFIKTAGRKEKINLHPFQRDALRNFRDHNKCIMCCSRQVGKALALDTPVITPNGWTTMGELKDGDIVYDNHGNETTIVKAWDVMYGRPCYKITFDNGEEIVADEGHLWFTQTKQDRAQRSQNKVRRGSKKTTKEIFETQLYSTSGEPTHRIPKSKQGFVGIEKKLSINPYDLGVWLGNGHADCSRISVCKDDLDALIDNLSWKNISIIPDKRNNTRHVNLLKEENTFKELLQEHRLIKNKHIPTLYKESSRTQRLELLRGIMDTDGTVRKQNGGCEIALSDKTLIDDVYELILSLGYKASMTEKNTTHKISYRINFTAHDYVFKMDRKRSIQKLSSETGRVNYHYIKKVEKVESVPVRCITVDSEDAMFLCGKTHIPSSNTTLMTIYALWLITFYEHQDIVIIANKEKIAKEILKRIKLAYEELPNWIKPDVGAWNKESIEFGNGSSIMISATSNDAIRGMALSCVTGDSIVTIKDKNTNVVRDISMVRLTNILKNNGKIHGYIIDED
jgi:hypothetical protein